MILRSIAYESSSQAPSFEITGLGPRSELSGGPASGKTLILNVIACLAESLAPPSQGHYTLGRDLLPFPGLVVASFTGGNGDHLEYRVGRTAWEITSERVTVNGNALLTYESNRSKTFFAQLGRFIEDVDENLAPPTTSYYVSRNNRARASRVDYVQHPYLIPLINWAHRVHHFNAEETAHDRNVRIDTAASVDELTITTGAQVRAKYLSGTERRRAQLSSVVRMLKEGGVVLIDDYKEDLWPGFDHPMSQVIVAHSTSYSGGREHVTHDLSCVWNRVAAAPRHDNLTPWPATPPPPRSA